MAMSYGGPKGKTAAEYYSAVNRVISHIWGAQTPYFTNIEEAMQHHDKSGILYSLTDPWPLAESVLFQSSVYQGRGVRIGVDVLKQLIPIADQRGIDASLLQQGLQAWEKSGGKKLASLRAQLFEDSCYAEWDALRDQDCSLAHLQRLKFVEYKMEEQAVRNRFIFTDPQEPKTVYEFSNGQLQAWLKNAGDDKKLIPEFVKAQEMRNVERYLGAAVAGVTLVTAVFALMLGTQKIDDNLARRYFDADEVVSNRATGRYLVNPVRGTVADGPLPSTPDEAVTVYDVQNMRQKTVSMDNAGDYQETSSEPVTDYQKLGQVVAAWNRVQGQGEVNAERLTEIFALEANLATKLKATRAELRSAVATTP